MSFSLEAYLRENKEVVDGALKEMIPEDENAPPRLLEAMRYSLFAGGKRIRPILAIAGCEAFGSTRDHILPAACALEMIHTYSLIHDDLPALDDDELRRGKPSSHVVFGEDIAILAGDALLTMAFEVLSSADWPISPVTRLSIISEIARSAGLTGMVGGQEFDLSAVGRRVTGEDITKIHRYKTAELITCSMKVGAMAAGVDDRRLGLVSKAGKNIGLAFQAVDDILGIVSSEEKLGKPVGSDEKSRKATSPSVWGLEKSKRIAQDLTDNARAELERLEGCNPQVLMEIARFVVERSF